ncbi:MAG: serine protease [Methylotenera sp.]
MTKLSADIDPSAVSIIVDQSTHRPLGTGFYFLQPKFFVTAKHVVVDDQTGEIRSNLVLMQNQPNYPQVKPIFLHPSLDLAVLEVDTPQCTVPLYPSDQRISGHHGLQYWGYAPSLSDKNTHNYAVAVVDIPTYECEQPRERSDGTEWTLKFDSNLSEGGHSGGPVLATGGGVVAVMIEGHAGWLRATEIRALLQYATLDLPAIK